MSPESSCVSGGQLGPCYEQGAESLRVFADNRGVSGNSMRGLGGRVRLGDGGEPGGLVSSSSAGDWVVIYRGAVSVVLSGWSNPGA